MQIKLCASYRDQILNQCKRKHLQIKLWASYRDQILLNKSREDSQFKRDLEEVIGQSNEFAKWVYKIVCPTN